jgi:TPR repeat protein
MNAAIDVNRPPYTKQYVDDYRKRMKDDPDPEAQFNFAKYMIEAAKKLGDEIAQTDPKLGRRYRDSLLQESLRLIKKLAEGKEPHADAQFFLANLYGTGQLGLQVDHEKAYYLYLMASKLNHPAATYRSAVCNEIGAGTKKDFQRAVLFYRKAAALGDTAAMYKLGMILLGGLLSQPRNIRESVIWLRRAASQADEDNPHALHELALLHERPNSGVLPHDPNLARELYVQAAQLGYAPAQFKLGSCHEFGHLGCVIDPRKSIAWYTRAAEKGDSEAELALSGWYLTGSGELT